MGWVIFILFSILLFYIISLHNRLVLLRNRFKNAFSQIDIQLKRRYDLIPNLVETVKQYMKHEKETFENIARARSQALSCLQKISKEADNSALIRQLSIEEGLFQKSMFAMTMAIEAYPDLKANSSMKMLSEELISTENKIGFARQGFNDCVTDYNTYRQSFPAVLLAGILGHDADIALLEFADSTILKLVPKVSFDQ